jgi:Fe2+ or Zn2+ uptake regulation protein
MKDPGYAHKALEVLRSRGYRITNPRRILVTLLEEAEGPLSAYEIKDQLDAAGEKVDLVSIYRIIDCLLENHLAHKVLSSGKIHKCQIELEETCHRKQDDHCHHFLICRRCEEVQEIHCTGLEAIADEIAQEAGFRVEGHHLEFSGLCRRCSQAPAEVTP